MIIPEANPSSKRLAIIRVTLPCGIKRVNSRINNMVIVVIIINTAGIAVNQTVLFLESNQKETIIKVKAAKLILFQILTKYCLLYFYMQVQTSTPPTTRS